jgi:hypothetical protein
LSSSAVVCCRVSRPHTVAGRRHYVLCAALKDHRDIPIGLCAVDWHQHRSRDAQHHESHHGGCAYPVVLCCALALIIGVAVCAAVLQYTTAPTLQLGVTVSRVGCYVGDWGRLFEVPLAVAAGSFSDVSTHHSPRLQRLPHRVPSVSCSHCRAHSHPVPVHRALRRQVTVSFAVLPPRYFSTYTADPDAMESGYRHRIVPGDDVRPWRQFQTDAAAASFYRSGLRSCTGAGGECAHRWRTDVRVTSCAISLSVLVGELASDVMRR